MKKQTKAFLYSTIVALGGFVFGLDAAVISGTVKFIALEFGLNDMQVGTVVSAPGFGVIFALLVTGWLCNVMGRKKTLILIAALYSVSAIASALAPGYGALVAARFLGGLAFTSITVAAMYIGEIAPPKWRGKLVSINQLNIVVGLTTAYFVNYLIIQAMGVEGGIADKLNFEENAWRYMLGSEIIPALVWLILLFFIPESPRWLVYRSRLDEAKAVLHTITPDDEIEKTVAEMEESLHHGTEELSAMSQVKELCHSRLRIAVIVAVVMAIVQQLSGINAILFYAPTVFEQLGGGTDTAFAQTLWIGVVSLVFTVCAILLVDRLGRRPMILIGLAWIAGSHLMCYSGFKAARYTLPETAISELSADIDTAALAPMVGTEYKSDVAFKAALTESLGEQQAREHSSVLIQKSASLNATLILVGILSFIGAFHFSVGPLMWVLFSELFPTSLRGVAIPIFAFITSVTSWGVQKFFPWQLANMGGATIFMFYAVVSIVGLVILLPFLPETKNMSIEEIQLALEKKTSKA